MRKRKTISKLSPGRHRPGLRAPQGQARAVAAHLSWAARIAKKFAARPAMRNFSRARLTDLAIQGSMRHDHWVAQWIANVEHRQWVRNVFRYEVRQQLFIGRPMPWKHGSEPPVPAGGFAGPGTTIPARASAAAVPWPGSSPYRPFLLHTASRPRIVAGPLTLAAARTQPGPGGVPPRVRGERGETAVALIARRYQRLELKREPVATAFLSASPMAQSQPGWSVAERSRAATAPAFAQSPRSA